MTKRAVTTTWLTGLGLLIVGGIIVGAGVGVMFANGGTWSGAPYHSDFSPTMNDLFWGSVAMMATGGVLFLTGGILHFVAWIGAMVNTARSSDKTWFILLLVLGLLGLQLFIMIAYLVAGPDVPRTPFGRVPMPPPLAPPQPPSINAAA
jgi:hypothetical protein